MATYAIGDIQGCWRTLQRLQSQLPLRPEDRLWLVGDLVNRGPRSLDCLRWARDQGERASVVLGNHDLKLLQLVHGLGSLRKGDTLREVLDAPDVAELAEWLATRPLLVRDGSWVLVHAGLFPAWSVDDAARLAAEAEAALRGPGRRALLEGLKREARPAWDDTLAGVPRTATIVAALTRMRTVSLDGEMDDDFAGELRDLPRKRLPWFQAPGRRSTDHVVVFGHWSALGLHLAPNAIALDTGCTWGRSLTAVRLEDRAVFQEPAAD